MNTFFLNFHEKRKQVHGKSNALAIFHITIYRSIVVLIPISK